jgi:hypothetical protein
MDLWTRLNDLLSNFLYKLKVQKPSEAGQPPLRNLPETPPAGTSGKLDADAVLLAEDGRVVLSVGHDFADVPSWVEWDAGTGRLSIVQMAGAVAELALTLPAEAKEKLGPLRRLALVTGSGPEKLMHHITFIARG